MSIDALNLAPVMEQRARELQTLFPEVAYLSGRRGRADQAHAMAANIVATGDRRWVAKTYKNPAELQTRLDYRPEAKTLNQIEAVLYEGLLSMTEDEFAKLSDHAGGHAVDLAPLEDETGMPTKQGCAVIQWIERCPDTKWFTTREGKAKRWHWACHPSARV